MKIGIDVDDVVADLHPAWIENINRLHGTCYTVDDMMQWDFYKDWPGINESDAYAALTPELYTNDVKPIEGARDVIDELRRLGHEIVYITTCHNQDAWLAKQAWLERYGFLLPRDSAFACGPWATYKTKRECGLKENIPVLVDDSIANCEAWAGYALLVTRQHNKNSIWQGKRLRNFNQLVSEVKFMPAVVSTRPGAVIELDKESFMKVVQENQERMGSKPTNPKDAVATDKTPLHFVSGVVKAYASISHFLGNVKYGAWNYRAGGARASIYKAALDRHMDAWWEGEENDPVDGTPHLANALACINILIETSESGNMVDDRPPSRIDVLRRVYSRVEELMPKIRERYKDRKPKHFTREDAV